MQEGWITRDGSEKDLETNIPGGVIDKVLPEGRKVNKQKEKCQNENVPKGRKDNSIRSWLMRQKRQETLGKKKESSNKKT